MHLKTAKLALSAALATTIGISTTPIANAEEHTTTKTGAPSKQQALMLSKVKDKVLSKGKHGELIFDHKKAAENLGEVNVNRIIERVKELEKFNECVDADSNAIQESLDKHHINQAAKLVFQDFAAIGKEEPGVIEASARLIYCLIDCAVEPNRNNVAKNQNSTSDAPTKK